MVRSPPAPVLLAALFGGAALLLLARRKKTSVKEPARTKVDVRRRAQPRYRVVVVGAGFGGLQAALRLAGQPDVDLTVIDAHNHHLFQPLLYQVATAALTPSDIASPLRGVIPTSKAVRVLMETVTGIDASSRQVVWKGGSAPYDELIIATGSATSYFGHDSWSRAAPGLKTLDDALRLRRRILMAFERASVADAAQQQRLLTFVLIGAGPTGVEMAGSLAELARELQGDHHMHEAKVRIMLVEGGERVLPEFAPDLSQNAADVLRKLGVEIRTGTRVTGIEDGLVHLHSETIRAETVIWTAGTAATPVADWLGVKPAHAGRVPVRADLSLAGHSDVHVIGDASFARDATGKPLPNLASVAKEQGRYVADRDLAADPRR